MESVLNHSSRIAGWLAGTVRDADEQEALPQPINCESPLVLQQCRENVGRRIPFVLVPAGLFAGLVLFLVGRPTQRRCHIGLRKRIVCVADRSFQWVSSASSGRFASPSGSTAEATSIGAITSVGSGRLHPEP